MHQTENSEDIMEELRSDTMKAIPGTSKVRNVADKRKSTSSESSSKTTSKAKKTQAPLKNQLLDYEKNIAQEVGDISKSLSILHDISKSLSILHDIKESCSKIANAMERMAAASEKQAMYSRFMARYNLTNAVCKLKKKKAHNSNRAQDQEEVTDSDNEDTT